MSNIKLVISDIDGTLITSNHEVTEGTRAAALRLRQRGIDLALASSRPPRSIGPIADALGLQSSFAAFNGAVILRADGKVLNSAVLSLEAIARVKSIADGFGLNVWAYDERDWFVPVRDSFVEREEHTSGFSPVVNGYQESLTRDPNKLTVVGKPELVAEAEVRVLAELVDQVSASRSKPRFLDVTPYGMHKGSVVMRLAQAFSVSIESIAVIGDGPNDVEMFKHAGVSIAMGQAVDEVQAAAGFVTASNDDDGWARAMDQYVLAAVDSQQTVRSF